MNVYNHSGHSTTKTMPTKLVVDETLASEVKQLTQKEHAKQKAMWLGSRKVTKTFAMVCRNNAIYQEELLFSGVFYKMVDEVLANAIDVAMRYKTVGAISMRFDPSTGRIDIHNDGSKGIPCGVVRDVDGKAVYAPQLMFSGFYASTNHDSCANRDAVEVISAGVNGVGVKMMVINSSWVEIDTYDQERKIHYTQTFRDEMDTVDDPTIEPIKRGTKTNGTRVSFIAQWANFKGWPETFNRTIFNAMEPIFRARLHLVSAYLGIPVMFDIGNGPERIETKTSDQLTRMMIAQHSGEPCPSSETINSSIIKPNSKATKEIKAAGRTPWQWQVSIAVDPNSSQLFSVVNGVAIYAGAHINHIIDQISAALRPKFERAIKKVKYNRKMVVNNIALIMVCTIPNIEFPSQMKDKLVCAPEIIEPYRLKAPVIKAVCDQILEILYRQHMVVERKTKSTRTHIKPTKDFEPPYQMGKRSAKNLTCFLTEGKSASSMIRTCLTDPSIPTLSFDNCGILCGGGVNINAWHEAEVKYSIDPNTNKETRDLVMSKRLQDSPKFALLCNALKLDPANPYTDAADLAKLPFKRIIIATDADVDGHNICGMYLATFTLLWPGIVQSGMLYRLNTPIQRWVPSAAAKRKGSRILSFYTDEQYTQWAAANPTLLASGTVKYYKGLAAHTKVDTRNIFQHFNESLTRFTYTEHSEKIISHLFAKDSTMRKIYLSATSKLETEALTNLYKSLSRPGMSPLDVAMYEHVKPVTRHHYTAVETEMTVEHFGLRYHIEYQKANNSRSFIGIDGLLTTHRKCVYTGMVKSIGVGKVFEWGGHVTTVTKYHHGSDSVEGCLITLAQNYIGAAMIPMFKPIGEFGSRANGGTDKGSSRYISTDINPLAKLYFRIADQYVLDYVFEDGIRVEPKVFYPITSPTLNTYHNIGHGWANDMYMRDLEMAVMTTEQMINGYEPMPIVAGYRACGWKGKIVDVGGVEYTVGTYIYDESNNILTITELPFQVWNKPFIYDGAKGVINKTDVVDEVRDMSSGTNIDIRIQLKPGAIEHIMESGSGGLFDPIVEYFKLRSSHRTNINIISPTNHVIHFKTYREFVVHQFAGRRDMYGKWVAREIVHLDLQIMYYENLVRFIDGYDEYNVPNGLDEDAQDRLLHNHSFMPFKQSMVANPEFTPVDSIIELATDIKHGASFDYIHKAHNSRLRTPTKQSANKTKLDNLRDQRDRLDDPAIIDRIWLDELRKFRTDALDQLANGIRDVDDDWY